MTAVKESNGSTSNISISKSTDDLHELLAVVDHLKTKASTLTDQLGPLVSKLKKDSPSTSNGVSLLEVKLHSLLSYLTHLSFFTLLKLQGSSVSGHPVIDSLVEARTVLEKIRPLEQKLKYQIDKLLKSAVLHADGQSLVVKQKESEQSLDYDPLAFKPNPAALLQSNEGAEKEEQMTGTKDGIYRPPRLVPMPYTPDEEALKGKLSSKLKERSSRSRLLKDLRHQFDERPEEMSAEGMGYGGRDAANTLEDRTWTEREAFEEENFMRLNMTKADKKLVKKLSKKGALMRFQNEFQDLDTDFNDLAGLNRAVESEDRHKFGKEGILRQRAERQAGLKESGGSLPGMKSKRKFAHASDAISSFARSQKSALGKSDFKKALKRQRK